MQCVAFRLKINRWCTKVNVRQLQTSFQRPGLFLNTVWSRLLKASIDSYKMTRLGSPPAQSDPCQVKESYKMGALRSFLTHTVVITNRVPTRNIRACDHEALACARARSRACRLPGNGCPWSQRRTDPVAESVLPLPSSWKDCICSVASTPAGVFILSPSSIQTVSSLR